MNFLKKIESLYFKFILVLHCGLYLILKIKYLSYKS